MEDSNKYYTPSLEEFHVGFEYENWVKGKGWTKRVVEDLGNVDLNEDNACLDGDDYRVKRLDKEDIESLGFLEVKDGKNHFEHKNHTVITLYNDRIIIITSWMKVRGGYTAPNKLFEGIIKNKSELKKLLQQLQII